MHAALGEERAYDSSEDRDDELNDGFPAFHNTLNFDLVGVRALLKAAEPSGTLIFDFCHTDPTDRTDRRQVCFCFF